MYFLSSHVSLFVVITAPVSNAPVTQHPTIVPQTVLSSPSPTPPKASSATTSPDAGPIVVDDTSNNGVYAVVFNLVYLNLFIVAPNVKAPQEIEHASYQEEFERIVSAHILNYVRTVVTRPRLVAECLTDITTVSTIAPWANTTVISSNSVEGTVQFHKKYGATTT